MTSGSDTIPWDRLSPPPREVSPSVAVRVRLAEIKRAFGLNQGFLRLWFLLVGVFLIIFGTAWYNGAKQEDHPVVGALLAAGGVGIVIVLFTLVYRRGSRGIELLRSGAIAPIAGPLSAAAEDLLNDIVLGERRRQREARASRPPLPRVVTIGEKKSARPGT